MTHILGLIMSSINVKSESFFSQTVIAVEVISSSINFMSDVKPTLESGEVTVSASTM